MKQTKKKTSGYMSLRQETDRNKWPMARIVNIYSDSNVMFVV